MGDVTQFPTKSTNVKLRPANEVQEETAAFRATDSTRDLEAFVERMRLAIEEAKGVGLYFVCFDAPERLHPELARIASEAGYRVSGHYQRYIRHSFLQGLRLDWGVAPVVKPEPLPEPKKSLFARLFS